ncbi:hypothetical protein PIROE2DRAFT_14874 [Piromyces sp. E2]|nr:hypothetical protein PIROE2DRAFT_14874 [Piromyces sp. E2]|eukprot:OUM59569.1 hypothetical protein PIROE2DRAFT_14874 [Piromyces sp. E2]
MAFNNVSNTSVIFIRDGTLDSNDNLYLGLKSYLSVDFDFNKFKIKCKYKKISPTAHTTMFTPFSKH